MGTETRVGIVAGLLIVVIASLYFYYGQSRPDQDIIIASNTSASPPPKIPVGALAAPDESIRKPEQFVQHTPVKPAITPPISSRGATPSYTNMPTFKPVDSPALAQATPPARPSVAPVFPSTTNKPAPVVKKSVDINDDSSDDSGDLSESTWDHLASTPAQPVKPASDPVPSPAASTSSPPVKFATANSPRQLSASPMTTSPRTTDVNETIKPVSTEKNSDQSWPRKHTVAKGDTLSAISFAYYEDHNHINDILTANPKLKSPKALRVGQTLEIPAPKNLKAPVTPVESNTRLASADEPRSGFVSLIGRSPTSPATEEKKPITLPDKTPKAVTPKAEAPDQSYTARDGDTFYSIAKKVYGDSKKWQRIYDANKAVVKNNPKGLRKGMTLTIPR